MVEILERARDTFVGTVEISRNYAFLLPDNRKMPFDIFIPLDKLKGVEHGQKAIAKIIDWPENVRTPLVRLWISWDTRVRMIQRCIPSWPSLNCPIKFSEEVEAACRKDS